MENKYTASLSLSSIGIIVGIILCILQGVGTINIGWFWASFAFWIVPAVYLSIVAIIVFVSVLIAAFTKNK